MSAVLMLSLRSIANRRLSVALTVLAVALAVALLLGVERLRNDARAGFAQTIAGTDLVVGARGGAVQLLLYSVFHIGDATANLSWASVEHVAALPQVKWLVPLALGDSHRGHRVVGTTKTSSCITVTARKAASPSPPAAHSPRRPRARRTSFRRWSAPRSPPAMATASAIASCSATAAAQGRAGRASPSTPTSRSPWRASSPPAPRRSTAPCW